MKRRVLAAVVVGLVFFTACTGTENAAPRARNSTLGSVDVKNGNFAAGGGGWLLAGVELGAGCNASGGDPSLGTWKKNALAFGYRKSSVTQSVVIPNPSTVVLKIDGAVRFDQSDSTFVVDLKSMTQAVSTGTQTGAVLVTPQTFTLSVATTAPNESVTISATGNSSKFWAGCYGPMLSNASITVTPNASPIVIVAPTTSIAVAPATTSTLAVTPTTTPTTTTIAPVPTTLPVKVSPTTTVASTTTVATPVTTIPKVQSNATYAVPTCVVAANANCSNTYWKAGERLFGGDSSKDVVGVNLSGAVLRGVNLGGLKFPGVDLHQADLSGARADGASFVSGNFVDANLNDLEVGSTYENAALSDFRVGRLAANSNFSGADFSYAQMVGAHLQGANFTGANFTGTDLSGANFFGANLDRADLRNAVLVGVRSGLIIGKPLLPRDWSVESGYLVGPGADLSVRDAVQYIEEDRGILAIGQNIQDVAGSTCPVIWQKSSRPLFGGQVRGYGSLTMKSFARRDLTGINFAGLDLRGTDFASSELSGAVFSGTNLESADFSNAKMTRVSFDYATFKNANFKSARWEDISSGCTTSLDAAGARVFPYGWKLDSTVSVVTAKKIAQGRTLSVNVAVRHGVLLGDTANLAGVNIIGLNLAGVDLSRATLSGVQSASIGEYFVESGFRVQTRVNLPRGWDMVKGVLVGPEANLENANLTDLDLRYVGSLAGASLRGAFALSGLKFEGSLPAGWAVVMGRLVGPGANITRASLGAANLTGVDLEDADVSGADMSRANLTGARGVNVLTDRGTRLPDGWRVIGGVLLGPSANLDSLSRDFTGSTGRAGERASFTGVDLRGASLKDVEMKGIGVGLKLPPLWKVVEGSLVGPTARVAYSQIRDLAQIAPENLPAGYVKNGNNIVGPNISISQFVPRDLANVDLSGSSFVASNLGGARMTNVRAVNINFTDMRFPLGWRYLAIPTGGVLVGPSANLSGLDLSFINLNDIDIRNANLSGAKGRFVTVNTRTQLPSGWKVIAGILFGPTANLSGANLSGLDLSGLDLSGATLDGARGTNIRNEPRELPNKWKVIRGNLVGPSANLICTSLDDGNVPWDIARTARVSAEANPNLFEDSFKKHMPC